MGHRIIEGHDNTFSKELLKESFNYKDGVYPKVSIIIPVYNNSSTIGPTLDPLLEQNYPNYEIIILDGGSTDRSIEVVRSYRHANIRIHSFSGNYRYEMLNKGISHSTGTYLNFLLPGDFYLNDHTLKNMMGVALHHEQPSLVFSATLLREDPTEVRVLHRHLCATLLKKGQQPTSLQSCWFKKEVFSQIGKFSTDYSERSGFEFMCRFAIKGKLKAISTPRVCVDYNFRNITRSKIVQHFKDTYRIIYHYFGLGTTFLWFFRQKDTKRYLELLWKSLKTAFIGR